MRLEKVREAIANKEQEECVTEKVSMGKKIGIGLNGLWSRDDPPFFPLSNFMANCLTCTLHKLLH